MTVLLLQILALRILALSILALSSGLELLPLEQPPALPESAIQASQVPGVKTDSPADSPADFRSQYPAGVAWWGTWEGATGEARRSGKPILLLSAAPQCHGIPGIW
ncbi:MAG TPA: hypothetical protein EYQ08_10900 [Planctomycetes bacterium]|nr:hypothetical protein [Planctomycetota bacterium]HIK83463.1 hypothetical protein [Planctomycetota bacterium]